jgi:uncharacterized protein DUF4365
MPVGQTNTFEWLYKEKFRAIAVNAGVFTSYEQDQGGRDIGVHLVTKIGDKEEIAPSICWFQLKGISKGRYSPELVHKHTVQGHTVVLMSEELKNIKIKLDVKDMQKWYVLDTPTYLAAYVEDFDEFFFLNIQKYIEENFGKDILFLNQATKTINIPTYSRLDSVAFFSLLNQSFIAKWSKILDLPLNETELCFRDHQLIFALGLNAGKPSKHKAVLRKYLSKTRFEMHFLERNSDSDDKWIQIHEHWQGLYPTKNTFEEAFPYLDFSQYGLPQCETEDGLTIYLADGSIVHGALRFNDIEDYHLNIRLNSIGRKLVSNVQILIKAGVFQIDPSTPQWISVAPWDFRCI